MASPRKYSISYLFVSRGSEDMQEIGLTPATGKAAN